MKIPLSVYVRVARAQVYLFGYAREYCGQIVAEFAFARVFAFSAFVSYVYRFVFGFTPVFVQKPHVYPVARLYIGVRTVFFERYYVCRKGVKSFVAQSLRRPTVYRYGKYCRVGFGNYVAVPFVLFYEPLVCVLKRLLLQNGKAEYLLFFIGVSAVFHGGGAVCGCSLSGSPLLSETFPVFPAFCGKREGKPSLRGWLLVWERGFGMARILCTESVPALR